MSRIPYLTIAEMTPRQREVNEIFLADRGGEAVSGPVAFWMRNPELGLRHEQLRLHMERATSLPRALSEIAILVANRHWSAEFPWCRHLAAALRAGVEPAALDVLRTGGWPEFADPVAQAVHDVARRCLETAGVDDATYRRAVTLLGETATIETVAVTGYGTLLSLSANTFGPEEPEPTDCTLPPAAAPTTNPAVAAHASRLGSGEDAADIWNRVPDLAAPWTDYDSVIADQSSVSAAMRSLVALRVARFWQCPPLWRRHAEAARRAGLAAETVTALAAGQPPGVADADLAAADAMAEALLAHGIASDARQNEVIARLGTTTCIELVAVVGFETTVALTLNVFGPRDPNANFAP